MQELDKYVKELLEQRVEAIENYFDADCVFYFGSIYPSIEKRFREFLELLQTKEENYDRLVVFVNSPGGSAEIVEKMVEIIRHHYSEVYFVVPDEAMSAGTILCMSGDKIYMDYSSSLGPIDPQVFNGKDWVPALGYLDQVENMIRKSASNTLTDRISAAVETAKRGIDPAQRERLREVQARVEDLRARGLLKKQEFVSVSTAEFERRYLTS